MCEVGITTKYERVTRHRCPDGNEEIGEERRLCQECCKRIKLIDRVVHDGGRFDWYKGYSLKHTCIPTRIKYKLLRFGVDFDRKE